MRFLCIYKPGRPERNEPPDPKVIAEMGTLISDMTKAGVLLATEGCAPSAKGVRLRIDSGKFTVTDGPFPETKELIAGFALIQVKSKEEAIEWGKRFLKVMGEGESEIRQINEQPPTAA
jgi:hypothetical protein